MNIYINILKLFLNKDIYYKYKDTINIDFIKDNAPELLRILNALDKLHERSAKDHADIGDLEASILLCYPQASMAVYSPILERIGASSPDEALLREYLESARSRAIGAKLGLLLLDFAEGKVSRDVLDSALENFREESPLDATPGEEFVTNDIELLYEKAVKDGGLRWRLGSLNRSLGPLRKGDFGFIFARPETGKTSFLASEASFMAEQTVNPILWVNNEEQGEKVGIRCYEASLGANLGQILASKRRARDAYLHRTGDRIKIKDDAGATRSGIEKLCRLYQPSLIIVDQLDKVQGFDGDREDLRMGAIYQWARELAKRFAPVIGVSQADGSGEGIKYLTMGNVANAKTAKQAEADWILGIGLSYEDPPNVRGFSICKNKLIGGEESVQKLRHARWDVLLDPEIGRYSDVAGNI